MMANFFDHVREHDNPHIWLLAFACLPELEKNSFPYALIESYPLDPDDREIINRYGDFKKRWLTPWSKGDMDKEAKEALPIYQRPLSPFEWKRNPYHLDGNYGGKGLAKYNGLDFLLVYWMGRCYKVIGPKQ